MSQFIAYSLMLAIAALIQMTDVAFINGVKPDIALVLLASIFYFDRAWRKRVLYVLIAGIILKFTPMPEAYAWLFFLAAFIMAILIDYLPWSGLGSVLVAILVGTAVMNAQSFVLLPAIYELAYNLIAGLAVFMILLRSNDKTSRA